MNARRRTTSDDVCPARLVHLLGLMGDKELAKLAGVTPYRARVWRLERQIEAANMTGEQHAQRERRRAWTAAWAIEHDVAFTRAEFEQANGLTRAAADNALRDATKAGLLIVVQLGRHGDRYAPPTMWCAA